MQNMPSEYEEDSEAAEFKECGYLKLESTASSTSNNYLGLPVAYHEWGFFSGVYSIPGNTVF